MYAVEKGKLVETMKELVASNNQESVVKVVEDVSEIKEKVDAVVVMPIGMLTLHGLFLSQLVKARDQVLKKDGLLIPTSLKLMASAINDDPTYSYLQQQAQFWQTRSFFGVDLSSEQGNAVMQHFAQTLTGRLEEEALMASRPAVHDIDLKTITLNELEKFAIELNFDAVRNGQIHGIGVWFELQLINHPVLMLTSKIASGPSNNESQWYTCRYILPKPIAVSAGMKVEGAMSFNANEKHGSYNVVVNLRADNGIRSSHAFPMNHYITHPMTPYMDNSMDSGWHFCDTSNNNVGPVTKTQLRRMSSTGSFTPGSFVWKEGMADWTVASEVDALHDVL